AAVAGETASRPRDLPVPNTVGPRFSYRWVTNIWGLIFCLPALALLIAFKFVPMLEAFGLSFTSYDLLSPPRFVGLDNYRFLLTDPNFHQASMATAAYVAGTTVPTWALALGLAWLLNRRLPGRAAFRVLY